ncbi:MAG: hypothetical protein HRU69_02385 [Flammeovirgaceae bacterium]|nr:MAG: hypothetical protein HRU69_02385 [Flammeovirgaceae bacterium]
MTFRTILFLGVFIAFLLVAYFSRITSVTICGNRFNVPADCSAQSPTYLKCENYDLSWLHVDDNTHDYIVQDLLLKREKEKRYKKTEIRCLLLNTESKGFKLTATTSFEKSCILIVHGKVNDQSVIVNLSMPYEPKTTKELPKLIRQIIQLND